MISFLKGKSNQSAGSDKAKQKKTQQNKAKQRKNLRLSKKHAWFLWGCQSLNIAVIAIEISNWMLAAITLCLLWQALLLIKVKPEKSSEPVNKKKTVSFSSIGLVIFAILGCIAIAMTTKQVGLLGSMIHLLCFSYVLKAFELKARSDFYQLFLLGVFILAASLIFRQDLAFTLIATVLLIVNLAMLLHFFSAEKNLVKDIKIVTILLGQSAVLAVMLFLFFPRIAPFWQVPSAKSAETGLSDTVKPGDIANLSRSNKLAFRVSFEDNKLPRYSQLYWRAMVLEDYDGNQWTKSQFALDLDKLSAKSGTSAGRLESSNAINASSINDQALVFDETTTQVSPLTYQIILEPSFQKHLLALTPAIYRGNDKSIVPAVGYTFRSNKIITQAKPYQLTSFLTAPISLKLMQQSYNQNLSYPQGSNPRLEEMALQLQQDYPDSQQRAQAVLDLINVQEYFYTLQPPLLDDNSLDQFFFDTQAGFCVHYASAFTFLMRASGIPARMVTGYLGGEYNQTNNSESSEQGHLSIYQYDAHAWSEIWVLGKGWLRVDPTSAVNPERVNSGFSDQLLQERSQLNNELFSLYKLKNIAFLNMLRLKFDALDYQWTRWVIGFDSKQQYELFKKWFGHKAPWKLALIIGAALILSMLTLMLILQFINRTKPKHKLLTDWQQLYQRALALLAKKGLTKPASMTVNVFAKEVRQKSPKLAIAFTRLSGTYNRLSYQVLSEDEQRKLALYFKKQYSALIKELKKSN